MTTSISIVSSPPYDSKVIDNNKEQDQTLPLCGGGVTEGNKDIPLCGGGDGTEDDDNRKVGDKNKEQDKRQLDARDEKGKLKLAMLLPMIDATHHAYLNFYCFFASRW